MKHKNNYDFIRVIAAALVIISHQFALFGLPEPLFLQYQTLGGFGVLVFFSISGYLVGHSWDADPNIVRFSIRRLLRIWPAFIIAVLICVFIVGPLFTSEKLTSYFGSGVTWSYFKNIAFIFQPFLPGVFSNSPVAFVPNGVYWTLPIEMSCYLAIAVLGALGLMRFRWVLLIITAALAYWYYIFYDAQAAIRTGNERYYYVQYATFFFYGVLLQKFKTAWIDRKSGVTFFTLVIASVLYLCDQDLIALFVFLPLALNAFGESSTHFLSGFGKHGDASYGLYIYAFPIQQITLELLGRQGMFAEKLILVLIVTYTISLLSWKYIEEPALRLKPKSSHLRRANSEKAASTL